MDSELALSLSNGADMRYTICEIRHTDLYEKAFENENFN